MSKGTPRRTVRVSDAKWNAANAKAEKEGRSVSDVLRDCLDEYLGEDQPEGDGKK